MPVMAWRGPDGAAGWIPAMNQLAIIAAAAQSYSIPFLLGGGHAVIAHGFARSTFDLDLIARQTDREKWLQLARSAGYEPTSFSSTPRLRGPFHWI